MSTTKIWHAINSGNLKTLTELLAQLPTDYKLEDETAQVLIDANKARQEYESYMQSIYPWQELRDPEEKSND